LSINGGQGIDLGQIIQILFQDQHFNNSKNPSRLTFLLVLGDLLNKRPATKKVEQFMAGQISLKIDSLRLDAKI
jgi:hypothetical protein